MFQLKNTSKDNYHYIYSIKPQSMKGLQKWGEILVIASQIGIALFTLTYVILDIRNTPVNDYVFIGLVIFLVIARSINLKGFKYILLTFLVVGTCNLLNTSSFSVNSYSSLEWQSGFKIDIDFNFFYFMLLLFYIGIHYKNIMASLEKTSKEVEAEQNKPSDNYLTKYYNELKEKDDTYLQDIISTKERWQKEYVMAAEQLLGERKI